MRDDNKKFSILVSAPHNRYTTLHYLLKPLDVKMTLTVGMRVHEVAHVAYFSLHFFKIFFHPLKRY
jgi:hypothetical protein